MSWFFGVEILLLIISIIMLNDERFDSYSIPIFVLIAGICMSTGVVAYYMVMFVLIVCQLISL